MNLSHITDTRYFHHYRVNIITKCAANDISNYTIIGHVYFGDDHFNGTANMCNKGVSAGSQHLILLLGAE